MGVGNCFEAGGDNKLMLWEKKQEKGQGKPMGWG
jgi:hypothetical protein